ncbi:hypothetical protein OC834_007434, partial [Tilletia horrida]
MVAPPMSSASRIDGDYEALPQVQRADDTAQDARPPVRPAAQAPTHIKVEVDQPIRPTSSADEEIPSSSGSALEHGLDVKTGERNQEQRADSAVQEARPLPRPALQTPTLIKVEAGTPMGLTSSADAEALLSTGPALEHGPDLKIGQRSQERRTDSIVQDARPLMRSATQAPAHLKVEVGIPSEPTSSVDKGTSPPSTLVPTHGADSKIGERQPEQRVERAARDAHPIARAAARAPAQAQVDVGSINTVGPAPGAEFLDAFIQEQRTTGFCACPTVSGPYLSSALEQAFNGVPWSQTLLAVGYSMLLDDYATRLQVLRTQRAPPIYWSLVLDSEQHIVDRLRLWIAHGYLDDILRQGRDLLPMRPPYRFKAEAERQAPRSTQPAETPAESEPDLARLTDDKAQAAPIARSYGAIVQDLRRKFRLSLQRQAAVSPTAVCVDHAQPREPASLDQHVAVEALDETAHQASHQPVRPDQLSRNASRQHSSAASPPVGILMACSPSLDEPVRQVDHQLIGLDRFTEDAERPSPAAVIEPDGGGTARSPPPDESAQQVDHRAVGPEQLAEDADQSRPAAASQLTGDAAACSTPLDKPTVSEQAPSDEQLSEVSPLLLNFGSIGGEPLQALEVSRWTTTTINIGGQHNQHDSARVRPQQLCHAPHPASFSCPSPPGVPTAAQRRPAIAHSGRASLLSGRTSTHGGSTLSEPPAGLALSAQAARNQAAHAGQEHKQVLFGDARAASLYQDVSNGNAPPLTGVSQGCSAQSVMVRRVVPRAIASPLDKPTKKAPEKTADEYDHTLGQRDHDLSRSVSLASWRAPPASTGPGPAPGPTGPGPPTSSCIQRTLGHRPRTVVGADPASSNITSERQAPLPGALAAQRPRYQQRSRQSERANAIFFPGSIALALLLPSDGRQESDVRPSAAEGPAAAHELEHEHQLAAQRDDSNEYSRAAGQHSTVTLRSLPAPAPKEPEPLPREAHAGAQLMHDRTKRCVARPPADEAQVGHDDSSVSTTAFRPGLTPLFMLPQGAVDELLRHARPSRTSSYMPTASHQRGPADGHAGANSDKVGHDCIAQYRRPPVTRPQAAKTRTDPKHHPCVGVLNVSKPQQSSNGGHVLYEHQRAGDDVAQRAAV